MKSSVALFELADFLVTFNNSIFNCHFSKLFDTRILLLLNTDFVVQITACASKTGQTMMQEFLTAMNRSDSICVQFLCSSSCNDCWKISACICCEYTRIWCDVWCNPAQNIICSDILSSQASKYEQTLDEFHFFVWPRSLIYSISLKKTSKNWKNDKKMNLIQC